MITTCWRWSLHHLFVEKLSKEIRRNEFRLKCAFVKAIIYALKNNIYINMLLENCIVLLIQLFTININKSTFVAAYLNLNSCHNDYEVLTAEISISLLKVLLPEKQCWKMFCEALLVFGKYRA